MNDSVGTINDINTHVNLVGYSLVVCVVLGPESGQACMLSVALAMFLNEILSQSVPTRQTLAIHRLYVKQN